MPGVHYIDCSRAVVIPLTWEEATGEKDYSDKILHSLENPQDIPEKSMDRIAANFSYGLRREN
tara:strand:+ start:1110 stop:1298 length:189 start_codon:yes stop_codon:yes gene_type:complete